MGKILVLGLGKQGKKYVEYFFKKGYIVDGVSQKKLHPELQINSHYIFEDILLGTSQIAYQDYEYICIAIAPIKEQERVICFLLDSGIENKIIIEKPIVQDKVLLWKLCLMQNIYFFIDEICLSDNVPRNIQKLHIFAKTYDIFDHAIGAFLSKNNFKDIHIKISFTHKYGNNLNYKVYINSDTILECKEGLVFINEKKTQEVNFYKSIEYVLNIKQEENQLIKNNFLLYLKMNY